MELTPLDAHLGETQGRLALPEGEIRFVLGDLAARREQLEPGDSVSLTQDVDLTGVALVRVQGELLVRDLPPGLYWQVAVLLDGTPTARLVCGARRTRRVDLSVPVAKLGGVHTVGVRLSLEAA